MMSISDGITVDVYQQMMDLKEKLKQSEAERMRLEEMFNVLLKTFKEEETIRLKNLEYRYQSFLEDCTRRSYRNEKILRSVERVENGANVLFAKTQRLKLLRNHYEAYMERVIPAWRETSIQYGPNQLSTPQKMEWFKQNQLMLKEIEEPLYRNYNENSQSLKFKMPFYTEVKHFPSHYTSDMQDLNRKRLNKYLSDSENYFSRNYKNQAAGEYKGRERPEVNNSKKDYKIQESQNLEVLIPRKYNQGKPLIQEEGMNYDEAMIMKELKLGLSNKLTFGNVDDGRKNIKFQENIFENMQNNSTRHLDHCKRPDQNLLESLPTHKFSKLNYDLPVEEHETAVDVSKNYEGEFKKERFAMIREPVEIKKPEIIIGKLDPEATLKFEHFNDPINIEISQSHNSNQDNPEAEVALNKLIHETDMKIESNTLAPPNNRSLFKQKNSINKLKETMMFEEKHDRKEIDVKMPSEISMRSEKQTFYDFPSNENDKEYIKSNEVTLTLSESCLKNIGEEKPQMIDNNFVLHDNKQEIELDKEDFNPEFNKRNEDIQDPEKDNLNELNEGSCEDNEETYPESYFEQPPKPDYSRNIASNVILEEDESEIYANEDIEEEKPWKKEIIQGEQSLFGPVEDNKNNPEYETTATQEIVENQYQNLEPLKSVINEGDSYIKDSNYSEFQQEQCMYENQEYNQNEGYNGEQYHAIDSEQNGYYEQPQIICNYEQEQAYKNEENNSGVEQYNVNYQQEYNPEDNSDSNFYDRGEYVAEYYENQMQERNEEQENVNIKNNATIENNQSEGVHHVSDINDLPLRQSNLTNFLESDSESFQIEHGTSLANEDSDFDFSLSQKQ